MKRLRAIWGFLVWVYHNPLGERLNQRFVRCPQCGLPMTCGEEDVEMNLEAKVIIGDWRCENGHVQRIIGNIHVEGDDED
jgi:hypothetical protein